MQLIKHNIVLLLFQHMTNPCDKSFYACVTQNTIKHKLTKITIQALNSVLLMQTHKATKTIHETKQKASKKKHTMNSPVKPQNNIL